jgi:acetylornithine/N-succinyldiaminopimelate aminotransferase
MATLTATGNRKIQAGFEPLLEGFVRLPYGDAAALEAIAAGEPDLVAVLVEPIQGEGGVNVPPDRYLDELRALCDRHGWLLMLDEIQTGMGRTGKLFACQHDEVLPDVITLAKGLGNGVPIGACLARGAAAELFGPGSHGSTFGGNPLACSAALAVLDVLSTSDLAARAAALGADLMTLFRARLQDAPGVVAVRGKGLMIGIELDRPCGDLVGQALAAGLLINVTADKVIRLLPPLVLEDEQAQLLVDTLESLIRHFLHQPWAGSTPREP